MPGQTAAAHGACRSGGVFPQYSSLWSGVLPRVSENPDGAATRKYFPASRFRRSVMQWGYLNRRMNRFFLARPVFSLMLGAPDRPHDAMTGPGLISLFCFLITAAYFLRGGMCAGVVLCMGLAFFSFSRRGWLRRSVTFLLQVSLLFWGEEAWRLARLWMMEGGPFLLWTSIPAAALLLHAAAILWRRRGEKNLPVPELARSRVFSVSVLLLFLLDALVPLRLLMGERILPWQGANGLAILLLAWWGGYCAEGLLNPQTSPRRRQVMWTVFASAFFLQFLLGVTVAPSLLMTGKLHIPVPFTGKKVFSCWHCSAYPSLWPGVPGAAICATSGCGTAWPPLLPAGRGIRCRVGKKPVTGGGFPLLRQWGFPSFCPCGAFRWGMPWRRRSP